MSSKRTAVVAIYDTNLQAKAAVDALVAAGVAPADIGGKVNRGGILLSVHCDASNEVETAKDVFRQTGGESFARVQRA